ncbi:hypothetical protein OUZ56_010414 [Daphnia magna]|uniref:Tudor domain-containing protein n=1 Tax=Daphnia magna TaxID=35525 RepID=A0ABR0AIH2_9CRUS|nr:hypothetical protein OUZ56_010414 [Daphnia magna]
MFADGRSLWETLTAIRSTPISSELPSPAVLLQGRNLRGSLPFLQSRLAPQFVPAKYPLVELIEGQRVRAFVSGSWLPGAVEIVCSELDSYVIRLEDGRAFRRTRRDINIDNSPSSGFCVGQQSSRDPLPSSAARGYRPASASSLLPALSWRPPVPRTRALNSQIAQSFSVAVSQQSTVPPLPPVVVSSSSVLAITAGSHAAPAMAGQPSSAHSHHSVSTPLAVVPPHPGSTRSGRPYLKPC